MKTLKILALGLTVVCLALTALLLLEMNLEPKGAEAARRASGKYQIERMGFDTRSWVVLNTETGTVNCWDGLEGPSVLHFLERPTDD